VTNIGDCLTYCANLPYIILLPEAGIDKYDCMCGSDPDEGDRHSCDSTANSL